MHKQDHERTLKNCCNLKKFKVIVENRNVYFVEFMFVVEAHNMNVKIFNKY